MTDRSAVVGRIGESRLRPITSDSWNDPGPRRDISVGAGTARCNRDDVLTQSIPHVTGMGDNRHEVPTGGAQEKAEVTTSDVDRFHREVRSRR